MYHMAPSSPAGSVLTAIDRDNDRIVRSSHIVHYEYAHVRRPSPAASWVLAARIGEEGRDSRHRPDGYLLRLAMDARPACHRAPFLVHHRGFEPRHPAHMDGTRAHRIDPGLAIIGGGSHYLPHMRHGAPRHLAYVALTPPLHPITLAPSHDRHMPAGLRLSHGRGADVAMSPSIGAMAGAGQCRSGDDCRSTAPWGSCPEGSPQRSP
jgi:hypothetical protein